MSRGAPRPLIATLTPNPALDVSFTVEGVSAGRKLRCHDVRRDPGGGGLNVARVIRRLGGRTLASFPAGGPIGKQLEAMVRAERVPYVAQQIAGETREDFTAEDRVNQTEYRFVLPGPRLRRSEANALLEAAAGLTPTPAVLVASGSLPPGAPVTFYGRLASAARAAGARLALDTAGAPLERALAQGVWLVKPNLDELETLVRHPLPDADARLAACATLVDSGRCQVVALSMGSQGALLVTADEAWRAAAPMISPLSTVGAGDSFMAALVMALAAGVNAPDALRRAVAAGSAALMAPGAQLCRAADVQALENRIRLEPVSATRSRPPAA